MSELVEPTPSARNCTELLSAMAQMRHLPSLFFLRLGREWSPQALPAEFKRGPKQQCYANAGELALAREDLTYVEGYACPPGLLPVHHAWCVDAAGRVIDPTFELPEQSQYYGVAMSRDLLGRFVLEAGHWGILAEMMPPEVLSKCLVDIQGGRWPAPAEAAAEIDAFLKDVTRG